MLHCSKGHLFFLPVNKTCNIIKNSIFASFLNGIFTDEMYSINMVDITKLVERDITDKEVEAFKQKAIDFYLKQDIVEKVWKNNIFAKLNKSA